jgi:tRNA dimethylallyltransferase
MTPIFCGGTGFYIDAIIRGISPIPNVSKSARIRARQMVSNNPGAAIEMLGISAPSDPQRLSRALEIFLETGRSISDFQSESRTGGFANSAIKILVNPNPEILKSRIAKRINEMVDGGALAEAKQISDISGFDIRAIGAGALIKFLNGEISREECIELWTTQTNQYAKRQRTWFRHHFDAEIVINNVPNEEDVIKIIEFLK